MFEVIVIQFMIKFVTIALQLLPGLVVINLVLIALSTIKDIKNAPKKLKK